MDNKYLNMEENIWDSGYTKVYDDFFLHWIKIIGPGPLMLYYQLKSFCYGDKIHAWPSVGTLAKRMGVTKNTVRKYRQVLIDHELIVKMLKRKSEDGSYQTNIYEIVRYENMIAAGQTYDESI